MRLRSPSFISRERSERYWKIFGFRCWKVLSSSSRCRSSSSSRKRRSWRQHERSATCGPGAGWNYSPHFPTSFLQDASVDPCRPLLPSVVSLPPFVASPGDQVEPTIPRVTLICTHWTEPASVSNILSQKLKELQVNNINNHECPIIANIFPPFLQFPKCPTLFHIFPPNSQPWVPITSFPPALPVLPWWPSNAPNALVQLGALAPGTANG